MDFFGDKPRLQDVLVTAKQSEKLERLDVATESDITAQIEKSIEDCLSRGNKGRQVSLTYPAQRKVAAIAFDTYIREHDLKCAVYTIEAIDEVEAGWLAEFRNGSLLIITSMEHNVLSSLKPNPEKFAQEVAKQKASLN